MARPPAKKLTERELKVMHAFWNRGESTVAEIRDASFRLSFSPELLGARSDLFVSCFWRPKAKDGQLELVALA